MPKSPATTLPAPGAEAAQHSTRLIHAIREDIAAQGGWISFARYMELALYAPGLGYYTAGAHKFGEAGDFITAPELSPLFGCTLARQVAEIMAGSAPHILELGAGSGKLAADMLGALDQLGCLPDSYNILEVSADLRQRQQHLLARFTPRVEWLDRLPASFSGLIVGNEVLDAMPVDLVAWGEDSLFERGVSITDGQFSWSERTLTSGELFDVAASFGWQVDASFDWPTLVANKEKEIPRLEAAGFEIISLKDLLKVQRD